MSSWKLEPTNIDATIYPLLTLFEMLKVQPFQKAEFTPEELDSRKRGLQLDVCMPVLWSIYRRLVLKKSA